MPFIKFTQHTSNPKTGKPMHVEEGYLRVPGGGDTVEFVVCDPTGMLP